MFVPGSRRYAGLAALAAVALTRLPAAPPQPPSGSSATGSGGGNADKANLTYWYWGESDAPGANDWMKARVADYEKLHPGVTIKLVPQSTDTLIGAFTTAAQTKTGPDIATQWATIPVLSQVWAGAVAPLSDSFPADQRCHWIGTQENTDKGKLYAVPLYVIGVPLAYNKPLFAKAGLTDRAHDLRRAARRLRQAQGGRRHADRHGQQGRLLRRLVLLQLRQAEPGLRPRSSSRRSSARPTSPTRSTPASTSRCTS